MSFFLVRIVFFTADFGFATIVTPNSLLRTECGTRSYMWYDGNIIISKAYGYISNCRVLFIFGVSHALSQS